MSLPKITNPKGYEIDDVDLVSVSEALRSHMGRYRVKGTITSLTKLFKMISSVEFYCDKCQKSNKIELPEPVFNIKSEDRKCLNCNSFVKNMNYELVNAICVELQDTEKLDDLERLTVFLFDKDTENIRAGENITIKGQIKISEPVKNKKLFPIFHTESIEYDNNDVVNLTESDIKAIKRYTVKHGSKIIDQLVKMFDHSVIGYENVKQGLLLSAVNSSSDSSHFNSNNNNNNKRQRIHSLLIGEKGLAKSKLLISSTRLVPNSRWETGPGSSGKSLTAIVDKEEENHILRLGPIPLGRNAICAINEFGRTSFEDQAHFLDVMEEGEFTINKYGINAKIKSPTTIIASSNPFGNSNWNDDEKIDIDEIPALKPVLDRFDLVFIFRSLKDEDTIREYAYKMADLESNRVPDYSNYLVKHLEYAKRFKPQLNDEAKNMLTEFFTKIRLEGFGSNRVLNTLYRLAKAVARLKLKEIVDEDDAKDVMSFYNVMLQNFQKAVNVSTNPKDIAYNEFVKILQNTQTGITIPELCKIATENNKQVKAYLGDIWPVKNNKKLRRVIDEVLNNSNIKKIGSHPIVLQWLSDHSDHSDHSDLGKTGEQGPDLNNLPEKDENTSVSSENGGSPRSPRSPRNDNEKDYPQKCYYCEQVFNGIGKEGYEEHMKNEHPDEPPYPGLSYLEERRIKPQDIQSERMT
jgi:replicative DNA helicase Mcm